MRVIQLKDGEIIYGTSDLRHTPEDTSGGMMVGVGTWFKIEGVWYRWEGSGNNLWIQALMIASEFTIAQFLELLGVDLFNPETGMTWLAMQFIEICQSEPLTRMPNTIEGWARWENSRVELIKSAKYGWHWRGTVKATKEVVGDDLKSPFGAAIQPLIEAAKEECDAVL